MSAINPRGIFAAVPARAYVDRNLTATDRDILGLLACFTDWKGECYPSYTTLAERGGHSRKTVIEAITKLEKFGYIRVTNRSRADGNKASNHYKILYDADLPAESEAPFEDVPDEEEVLPEPAAPTPPSVPAGKGKTEKPTFAVARALATVCKMSFDMNQGYLLKVATQLLSGEYSANKLYAAFGPRGVWYAVDWRGKTGAAPTPAQVLQLWEQYTTIPSAVSTEITKNDDGSYNL